MSRELSSEEVAIRDRAMVFARKNGKGVAADRTDVGIYPSDPNPVSVFMAGSPGAGKTEASKALLENVEKKGTRTVRIDPDELRELFEEYSGDNAWLFQPATSILVDKIHDPGSSRMSRTTFSTAPCPTIILLGKTLKGR